MMLGPVPTASCVTSSMSPKPSTQNTAKLNAKASGKSQGKLNGKAHSPTNGKRVLSDHVQDSISDYFQALNGHQPADLYRMVLEQVEAPLLRSVLDYCEMNQSRASEVLGINRGTLRKKLKQYDICS